MSLITDIINVSKISYWCLCSTVIMNIVLTSFWCNIPILEYMSTLWTSKCDHFDVTHNCNCQRHSSIIIMSLFSCDYKHHFDIILMLHTNTHGYEYIMNFKMWSFWCHLKQTLSTSLKYHIDVSIQLWLRTSSWHHFDVTYQY